MDKDREPRCFLNSAKALAIPVAYMILFVSIITIISATYSFSILRINAKSHALKASLARSAMESLDNAIESTLWSYGASQIVYFDDYEGTFRIQSQSKRLILNLTDGQLFNEAIFNSSAGSLTYQLGDSDYDKDTFFRGDDRSIINKSSGGMSQLYVAEANGETEIVLSYRPFVTVFAANEKDGRPINQIQVYIVTLNCSTDQRFEEKFRLRVSSLNVTQTRQNYVFNSSTAAVKILASIDNVSTEVSLPTTRNELGFCVALKLSICYMKIEQSEV